MPDPAPGQRTGPFDLHLTIPGQAEYLGVVRLAVAGLCHRLGLDPDDAEDLKLAVAEACSQAIQSRVAPDRIRVAISVDPERIQVDLVPHPSDATFLAPEGPGALGRVLVEALVDRVEPLESAGGLRLTRLLPVPLP